MNQFEDILHVPYPNAEIERDFPDPVLHAAQFAPFAALTGHDEAVEETARLTDEKIVLDESKQEELNQKLYFLEKHLANRPEISVTHFVPDQKKQGGHYLVKKGRLIKISKPEQSLVLSDETKIFWKNIAELECEHFPTDEL